MDTLVDEARLRVVAVKARPGAEQVVVQRRAAGGAAIRRCPLKRLHDRRDGLQAFFHDALAHEAVPVMRAGAHGFGPRAFLYGVAGRQLEQLLDQRRAGAAGGGRLGDGPHAIEVGKFLRRDCGGDRALANAVAAADFSFVRHGRNGRARVQTPKALRRGLPEHQRLAKLGDVGACAH